MSLLPSFSSGFLLGASLIVASGAQNMFVLRQGLKGEHVLPVVCFCAAADLVLTAAGVLGAGAGLRAVPGLALVLTLGGAAFLLCYGIMARRRAARPGILLPAGGEPPASLAATLGRTASFTFLNPHVYLDTVLLMGAVGGSQPGSGRPAFIAGAGAASLLWFSTLGFGARLLTPFFARPAAWRVLDGLVGLVMLALAAALVAGALR